VYVPQRTDVCKGVHKTSLVDVQRVYVTQRTNVREGGAATEV
jgi:hypothetical protein